MTMESRTGLIDASALTMDALDRAQHALGQMRLYLLLLRAAQDDERLADGQFREVHIFIREQMMALVQRAWAERDGVAGHCGSAA